MRRSRILESSTSDEEDTVKVHVRLSNVPNWDQLAGSQGTVTAAHIAASHAGAWFALEDRNSFACEKWRHILVRRSAGNGNRHKVFLCDADGLAIHEPAEGVVNGEQPLSSFMEEFNDDNEYYRSPSVCGAPRAAWGIGAQPMCD